MPDLDLKKLKKETQRAVQASLRKEGVNIRMRESAGNRIEGTEPIKQKATFKLKGRLAGQVQRIMEHRGIKVATIVRERQRGKIDIILTGEISAKKVYVGLKLVW